MKRTIFFLLFFAALLLSGAEKIVWEKAKIIASGIRLVSWAETAPRLQKLHCVRIDLKTPGLSFKNTGRDILCGKPMPDCPKFKVATKRQRTKDFLMELRKKKLNAVFAINTAPWVPWEKPFTHRYALPVGTIISDGVFVSCRKANSPTCIVRDNGKVEFTDRLLPEERKGISHAFSGFSRILRKGEITPEARRDRSLHPRTGCALSADGRYLYFLTVDGRQPNWSMGATTGEMAQIFLNAGASEALNLDGGGSTTLCYMDQEKNIPVVPTRHHYSDYQRPVGANFAVILEK